jgi:hypothetical protein
MSMPCPAARAASATRPGGAPPSRLASLTSRTNASKPAGVCRVRYRAAGLTTSRLEQRELAAGLLARHEKPLRRAEKAEHGLASRLGEDGLRREVLHRVPSARLVSMRATIMPTAGLREHRPDDWSRGCVI